MRGETRQGIAKEGHFWGEAPNGSDRRHYLGGPRGQDARVGQIERPTRHERGWDRSGLKSKLRAGYGERFGLAWNPSQKVQRP
jgi:hypothetical protein